MRFFFNKWAKIIIQPDGTWNSHSASHSPVISCPEQLLWASHAHLKYVPAMAFHALFVRWDHGDTWLAHGESRKSTNVGPQHGWGRPSRWPIEWNDQLQFKTSTRCRNKKKNKVHMCVYIYLTNSDLRYGEQAFWKGNPNLALYIIVTK